MEEIYYFLSGNIKYMILYIVSFLSFLLTITFLLSAYSSLKDGFLYKKRRKNCDEIIDENERILLLCSKEDFKLVSQIENKIEKTKEEKKDYENLFLNYKENFLKYIIFFMFSIFFLVLSINTFNYCYQDDLHKNIPIETISLHDHQENIFVKEESAEYIVYCNNIKCLAERKMFLPDLLTTILAIFIFIMIYLLRYFSRFMFL